MLDALRDRMRGLLSAGGRTPRTDGGASGGGTDTTTATARGFDLSQVLDGVGAPMFMLDANHEIVAWNGPIASLTAVSAADALGMAHASEAFYPDGRRAKTLADKVLEAPESADREFGLTRVSADSHLYEGESTMTDRTGVERHIRFTAMPIYEGDEVVGAVETVHDRTAAVEERRATSSLIGELDGTIHRVADGQLDARAEFSGDRSALDDELLEVVSEFNDMVARFERLTADVDESAGSLGAAISRASEAADDIEQRVVRQHELLAEGADEMQNLSASMEEIAATSDEVASAAEQARSAADNGQDAGERVHEATNRVIDISDDLLESVAELTDRMDAIEEVVEVIAEVADRTNLLALNANIEAARAGDAGDGFSVVADEVKQLANQTQEHTEEIAASISEIQAQADDTVDASETSHEQIQVASGQIEGVLEALEEIVEAADGAADGISEVARATDSQAANIEEVTATIQTVQDQAQDTRRATEEIADATDEQTDTIDELVEGVQKLRGQDAGSRTASRGTRSGALTDGGRPPAGTRSTAAGWEFGRSVDAPERTDADDEQSGSHHGFTFGDTRRAARRRDR